MYVSMAADFYCRSNISSSSRQKTHQCDPDPRWTYWLPIYSLSYRRRRGFSRRQGIAAPEETLKLRTEFRRKLRGDMDTFGDDLEDVVEVCTQIFTEFLHKHYGGPRTLLVEPFTNMMVAPKDRNLPGAAFAAQTSLLWAQNHFD